MLLWRPQHFGRGGLIAEYSYAEKFGDRGSTDGPAYILILAEGGVGVP